ncbi:MAG: hypothetical protein IJJ74_04780 [Eubacterium sp.]|nr:hypothetical protein [Eubacterium sp.]
MRRNRSYIILMLLLMTVFLGLTGCSSNDEVQKDGMTFVKLKDYLNDKKTDSSRVKDLKKAYNDEDGYICIVGNNASIDIVVPDKIEGSPVIALTSKENISLKPRSVQIGSNVKYIDHFNLDCSSVKELTVPDNVTFIDSSFPRMKDAVVTIEGEPKISTSFYNSDEVTVYVGELDYLSKIAGNFTYVTDEPDKLNKFKVGTEELIKYSENVEPDALLARAQEHFGEELDPGKKISEDVAGGYADYLDGPVISVKECPAIDYPEYDNMNKQMILAETEAYYVSVTTVADMFPEDAYQPKIDKPQKYFIVEKIGGIKVDYIGADKDYYKMVFRVSVRNIETDELAFWFEATPGYAPSAIRSDDSGWSRITEGGRTYFGDYDGNRVTPEYVIHKYLH